MGVAVTIEHGVGNQPTGVDDLVTLNSNRFAVSILEVADRPVLPLQLVRIQAVHITSMVLVEIGKLVVKQDGRVQIRRHVKLNNALRLRPQIRARVLNECVLRYVVLRFGIVGAELIVVLGDVDQTEGGEGVRRGDGVTVCVLERHFCDLKVNQRLDRRSEEVGIAGNKAQTWLFPQMSRAPIGAKMIPMMKSVGRTVLGVRIGCHAFRRCCLKAVSATQSAIRDETAGIGGVGTDWLASSNCSYLSWSRRCQ